MSEAAAAEGVSILETPTYVVSVIFFLFLVVSTAFERALYYLRRWFTKCGKHGLLAAVDNMTQELMLLGFLSFLLSAFQSNITAICSDILSSYSTWTVLGHARGCPCCIEHTKSVSECFLADRNCGTPGDEFCNCGGANTCPASSLAETASSVCNGIISNVWPQCGDVPGKRPLISKTALEQIHLLLFSIALVHIVTSIFMGVTATWRVSLWRQWEKEDDCYFLAVHDILEKTAQRTQGSATDASADLEDYDGLSAEDLKDLEEADRILRAETGDGIAMAAADEPEREVELADGTALPTSASHISLPESVSDFKSSRRDKELGGQDSQSALRSENGSRHAAGGFFDHRSTHANGAAHGSQPAAEAHNLPQRISDRIHEFMQFSLPSDTSEEVPELPDRVGVGAGSKKRWLQKQDTMHKRRRDNIYEWPICFLRQFCPNVLCREEFMVMRASFTLTHRLGKGFQFMEYIMESMDDDFAHVVGLSVEAWVVIIVYILLFSLIGFEQTLFTLSAAAVVLAVNTKLVHIIRHATRGGTIHRLDSSVFWFRAPLLLLEIIKTVLFMVSFQFTTDMFLAWQFGPKSCFFSSPSWRDNGGLPYYVTLIVNIGLLGFISFVTLPLYSMAVQMGSNLKHTMLPTNAHQRLQFLARKARQQELAKHMGKAVRATAGVAKRTANAASASAAKGVHEGIRRSRNSGATLAKLSGVSSTARTSSGKAGSMHLATRDSENSLGSLAEEDRTA